MRGDHPFRYLQIQVLLNKGHIACEKVSVNVLPCDKASIHQAHCFFKLYLCSLPCVIMQGRTSRGVPQSDQNRLCCAFRSPLRQCPERWHMQLRLFCAKPRASAHVTGAHVFMLPNHYSTHFCGTTTPQPGDDSAFCTTPPLLVPYLCRVFFSLISWGPYLPSEEIWPIKVLLPNSERRCSIDGCGHVSVTAFVDSCFHAMLACNHVTTGLLYPMSWSVSLL